MAKGVGMQANPALEVTLWRNASFVRLWLAKALSAVGSHVTAAAIPWAAAVTLHATPAQMALLVFASQLPDLLFGLLAGVWVDRVRRRFLLLGADYGRAALLALIPIAAMFDRLSMELLWFVAFGCASLSLIFTLASVAVLPSIVREEQLVDANAKLQMTDSVLSLSGPTIAGFLIQLVNAPRAIIADVVSFLASAWTLGKFHSDDQVAAQTHGKTGFAALRAEISEGLVELIRTPLLRALAISMGVFVVGTAVSQTVSMLYLTRDLGYSAAVIGLLAAFNGVGALIGATIANRVAQRLTLGKTMVWASFLQVFAVFLVPLAPLTGSPTTVIAVSGFCSGLAFSVHSVNQISLRQRITPTRLLGRVTAARRFLIFSMAPVGALIGGWLGTVAGYQMTLVAGACIVFIGAIIQYESPIRHER